MAALACCIVCVIEGESDFSDARIVTMGRTSESEEVSVVLAPCGEDKNVDE